MAKSKITKELKVDLKELNSVVKGLKTNYYTKIGIMGNKSNRGDTATNAELGVVHEFGSQKKGIPARSFLRMPLTEKRKELITFISKKKKEIENDLTQGKIKQLFLFIGIKAEEIIQNAFASSGFGKWEAKLKPGKPLIDTGQLRKSITSKVEKGGR